MVLEGRAHPPHSTGLPRFDLRSECERGTQPGGGTFVERGDLARGVPAPLRSVWRPRSCLKRRNAPRRRLGGHRGESIRLHAVVERRVQAGSRLLRAHNAGPPLALGSGNPRSACRRRSWSSASWRGTTSCELGEHGSCDSVEGEVHDGTRSPSARAGWARATCALAPGWPPTGGPIVDATCLTVRSRGVEPVTRR